MLGTNPPTPLDFRSIPDGQEIVIRNTIAKMERTFLPIGSKIGKYRILEEIDRGGMAVVYRATQLDLDRVVALKVLPATISINPRFLERFLAEAHSVSKLNHPSIVAIHEIAMEKGIHFIAMDYIPGRNLYFYLNECKPKLVDVLDIFVRVAEALGYAHQQRIVHRDLKLNNVIMRNDTTPVLIDFGLAKALENEQSDITRTGELVGSPAYMAPERILGGKVDSRSDICSLGIMLYEMLTFKNPYLDQRSIHQTTMNVIEADPIPPRKLVPWLPSEVEAITLKAMHPDPTRRYQTMAEFREDIVRYQHGEYVLAQPPSLLSRLRHFMRRYWPYVAISSLIVLFAFVLGLTYYIQSEKGKAHWQVIVHERFAGRLEEEAWTASPRADGEEAEGGAWSVVDGALVARGGGSRWIRLERPLTRDIRVECDLFAPGENLIDVGVFLYGRTPQTGYRFHLYRGGEARHGIEVPGNPLLVFDYNPLTFPGGRGHHVVIERRGRLLSMQVDGTTVARVWDYFPLLGREHQHFGLFVNGGTCAFDNLRVYQLAIPRSPHPMQIADRFWERGDFSAALDEYRALTIDFSNSEIARSIQLRIPDCLTRLGRHQEALTHLTRGHLLRFGSDAAQAEALYLQAVALREQDKVGAADSVLGVIGTRFAGTAVNRSAVLLRAARIAEQLKGGTTSALCAQIDSLAVQFPGHWGMTSRLHLLAVEGYLERERTDHALALTRRLSARYARDERIAASVQAALGHVYLCKRQQKRAVDILNRCVATHVRSEGVWEAWMLLASVYEHDLELQDALTIYRKVYRECSKGNVYAWMARIKMAELAARAAYEESPDSIVQHVISGRHPFALPRAIAQLYSGALGETQFIDLWHSFFPDDWYFLYHLARKALLDGEKVVAEIYLEQLLTYLRPSSWRYRRVYRMMNRLEKL